jgi:hypothetical protein
VWNVNEARNAGVCQVRPPSLLPTASFCQLPSYINTNCLSGSVITYCSLCNARRLTFLVEVSMMWSCFVCTLYWSARLVTLEAGPFVVCRMALHCLGKCRSCTGCWLLMWTRLASYSRVVRVAASPELINTRFALLSIITTEQAPWNIFLLEKAVVVLLVNKCPAFYGTRWSINAQHSMEHDGQ